MTCSSCAEWSRNASRAASSAAADLSAQAASRRPAISSCSASSSACPTDSIAAGGGGGGAEEPLDVLERLLPDVEEGRRLRRDELARGVDDDEAAAAELRREARHVRLVHDAVRRAAEVAARELLGDEEAFYADAHEYDA